jgi:hypothetical protein
MIQELLTPYMYRITLFTTLAVLLLLTYLLRDKALKPNVPEKPLTTRQQALVITWAFGFLSMLFFGTMSLMEINRDDAEREIAAGRMLGWEVLDRRIVGPGYEGNPPVVKLVLEDTCPVYIQDLFQQGRMYKYSSDDYGGLPQPVKDRLVANGIAADACDTM